MGALRFLFSFKGRISRAKIWLFVLISALAGAFLSLFDPQSAETLRHLSLVPVIRHFGWQAEFAMTISLLIVYLLLSWAWLAVLSKRLHDRGKSASWLIVFCGLPIVCAIVMVVTAGAAGLGHGAPDLRRWPVVLTMIAALVALAILVWGFVEFYCLRGTRGANRFGPDPVG